MNNAGLERAIPTVDTYRDLLNSELFSSLEGFSNAFLERNATHLQEYSKKWVRDPLHQWSRQWEYPYVYREIESYLAPARNGQVAILDAGSGVTFFPYYLAKRLQGTTVYCCDIDPTLKPTFEAVNTGESPAVSFSVAPLHEIPFPDGALDVVYCISVLEHARDRATIVNELFRVLRQGGKLLVTFDISLDGKGEISVPEAAELIDLIGAVFVGDQPSVRDELGPALATPNLVTTRFAKKIDSRLLPWRPPSLAKRAKSLVIQRRWLAWPPLYTVYGLSVTKRA